MNTALKSSSREGAEKPAIDAAIVPQMMETNMITRIAAAGLVALALTTSLSFGGIGDIFHPTGGGSEPIDIGGVFHNTDNDDPDFGEIFNPKPDTVINKHIDIYKPFPDLNIDFGNSTPAPGTMLDYGKLAKLNEGFALTCAVSGTPSEFPDDVVIARNTFSGSVVGANIMNSRRVRVDGNTIAGNRGVPGVGLTLKDCDDSTICRNEISANGRGLLLDGSSVNRFTDNTFRANDTAARKKHSAEQTRGFAVGSSSMENCLLLSRHSEPTRAATHTQPYCIRQWG